MPFYRGVLSQKIYKSGKMLATPCNVFHKENLSYFFVGRPAFKRSADAAAEYWELPICIIMKFDAFKPKRVYPFDTGGYGRYPNFIRMMEMNEFEVAADPEAAQKIIGTFFTTTRNYFNLKARPQSSFETLFNVEVLEEEIKALHKLIGVKNNQIDDRRFSIEFQCDKDLDLLPDNVLAVIVPETYLENEKVHSYIIKLLKAQLLTYPVFSLNKDYYYYAIYLLVERFMKKTGHFRV